MWGDKKVTQNSDEKGIINCEVNAKASSRYISKKFTFPLVFWYFEYK
jgi:hypothetical protein